MAHLRGAGDGQAERGRALRAEPRAGAAHARGGQERDAPDRAGDRTTGDLMATAADAPAAAVTVPTQDPMDAPSGGGVSRRSCQPFRPGAAGLRQTPWTPASDWLGWRASRYACIGAGSSLPR